MEDDPVLGDIVSSFLFLALIKMMLKSLGCHSINFLGLTSKRALAAIERNIHK